MMEHKFVRDTFSKGLINTDITLLEARREKKKQTKTMMELQEQITDIKDELTEIKQILQKFITHRG